MFISLTSLLKGKQCGPDVAMTGEISLRGLVLPVGGIQGEDDRSRTGGHPQGDIASA